ncbi:MAG TPA: BamA/TamA family outer membrane protein [Polyangiaceae bacterium LLY-WYZ-14_1]|nr:BamA/TamA family outer membrane protein [Polyangiaceae bacterium LLY-WYZ-14_1]
MTGEPGGAGGEGLGPPRPRWRLLAVPLLLSASIVGCAHVPKDRFGVQRLRVEGLETLDPEALEACLATRERPKFDVNFGTPTDLECGVPPFDGGRANVSLFSWPWTEWPTFDRGAFERDLERIERWFRARGYYEARVVSAAVDPANAFENDELDDPGSVCGAPEGRGCPVDVAIRVEEGEPVRVDSVALLGVGGLDGTLQKALFDRLPFSPGDVFDEALYDGGKAALRARLEAASYARAQVEGAVQLDPEERTATVTYTVEPGPPCVFGEVSVMGHRDLFVDPILGASFVRPGSPYDATVLTDAERAIYRLGAFASVRVEPQLGETAGGEDAAVIPVVIRVEPGRAVRYGVGAGIESGRIDFDNQSASAIPQWDVHLLFRFEHRNLFGDLQSLSIEERPRLIFRDVFPRLGEGARFGNELRLRFVQPAFLEPRTALVFQGEWDLGPPPFGGDFFRHDIDLALGPERRFLKGRLRVAARIRGNVYLNISNENLNEGNFDTDNGTLPGELTGPLAVRICDSEGTPGADTAAALAELETLATSGPDPDVAADAAQALDAYRTGTREGLFRPCDYTVALLEQILELDLRDQPTRTQRGMFFRLGLQQAGLLGSFDYFRVTPEARFYTRLPARIVLASRLALGATFILGSDVADVTTRRLGPDRYRLRGGGASSVRGYLPGALGDSRLGGVRRWEATVELRIPVTNDFGVVLFTDTGDVHGAYRLVDSPVQDGDLDDIRFTGTPRFRFENPHLSVGFGLRYHTLVGPLRFDVGFQIPGAQRTSGPPTAAEEASTLPFTDLGGAVHLTIGESF